MASSGVFGNDYTANTLIVISTVGSGVEKSQSSNGTSATPLYRHFDRSGEIPTLYGTGSTVAGDLSTQSFNRAETHLLLIATTPRSR